MSALVVCGKCFLITPGIRKPYGDGHHVVCPRCDWVVIRSASAETVRVLELGK